MKILNRNFPTFDNSKNVYDLAGDCVAHLKEIFVNHGKAAKWYKVKGL